MSTWHPGRRPFVSPDASWLAEDVELAPDWLQAEIRETSEDLRHWMTTQGRDSIPAGALVKRPGRRGRKPHKQ